MEGNTQRANANAITRLNQKLQCIKNNSYQCNNFINHAIYFKSNVLHITGRYKKWSFPND